AALDDLRIAHQRAGADARRGHVHLPDLEVAGGADRRQRVERHRAGQVAQHHPPVTATRGIVASAQLASRQRRRWRRPMQARDIRHGLARRKGIFAQTAPTPSDNSSRGRIVASEWPNIGGPGAGYRAGAHEYGLAPASALLDQEILELLALGGVRGEPARLLAAAGPGFLRVGRVTVLRRDLAAGRLARGALGRGLAGLRRRGAAE